MAAILASALLRIPTDQYFKVLIIALFGTVFFDLFISYIRIKKLFIPYAAIVSGLIIALLVDPTLAWYKIVAISLTSMAIKNFIRFENKHMLNPAATGLLVGGLIFGSYVSWWGVSFQTTNRLDFQQILLFIILLLPLYVSAYKMRRYIIIISFLISYAIIVLFLNSSFSLDIIRSSLFDPTVLFFSGVMLPEPMTSPSDKKRQFLYGVFVALASFIVSLPLVSNAFSLPDPFITALLLGNLIFFKK